MKKRALIKYGVISWIIATCFIVIFYLWGSINIIDMMVIAFITIAIGGAMIFIVWHWGGADHTIKLVEVIKIKIAHPGTDERVVRHQRNITHITGITSSVIFNSGETIPNTGLVRKLNLELVGYEQKTGIGYFKLPEPVRESQLPVEFITSAKFEEGTESKIEFIYCDE